MKCQVHRPGSVGVLVQARLAGGLSFVRQRERLICANTVTVLLESSSQAVWLERVCPRHSLRAAHPSGQSSLSVESFPQGHRICLPAFVGLFVSLCFVLFLLVL